MLPCLVLSLSQVVLCVTLDLLYTGKQTLMSLHWLPVYVHTMLAYSTGAEIYLRHPSRYNLSTNSDQPMTFSEVSEVVRRHQETALGYVLQDGTVISAPSANQQQVLQAGDQIIALAEQA